MSDRKTPAPPPTKDPPQQAPKPAGGAKPSWPGGITAKYTIKPRF